MRPEARATSCPSNGLADRIVAAMLVLPIVLILAVVCPLMLLMQGRPLFYASERMKAPDVSFRLYKLRTMRPAKDTDERVLGGDALSRVTPLGRVLRACRIDELPQILNILRGDLRFIGPRPPLPRYVTRYPGVYADVLSQPPGVTGLATVMFHAREARILNRCPTAEATEAAYRRECIHRKARLDRFYRLNRSAGLDVMILLWTFTRLRSTDRPSSVARKMRGRRLHRWRARVSRLTGNTFSTEPEQPVRRRFAARS